MEDTFTVRVAKVFGALSSFSPSPSPSKPLTSSLWSLTDEEIEKKEWTRDTETPGEADGPSLPDDVDGFFANRSVAADEKRPSGVPLKESGDVGGRAAGAEDVDEESEIKNSIGMDCTLDFEEEEDKYDRVAVGDEERADRVYMREIHDYGVNVSSFDEIPTSFREASRDPRANHLAAKLRLREDEEATKKSSLEVSSEIEMSAQDDRSGSLDERNDLKKLGLDEMIVGSQQDQSSASEAGKQVKSILKRKDDQAGSTSGKRVRFVPECKEDSNDGAAMVSLSNGEESRSVVQNSSAVPDYLRNPSKYTCYTFEEIDDLNEKSNQQGYMDFLNALRKSKQVESDEPPVDLSQRVIFNPKRKARDAVMGNDDNKTEQLKDTAAQDLTRKKSLPASIEGEDAEESDVCAMEEDPPQMEANRINSRNRTSRQYRSKIIEELDESAT